MRAIEQVRKVLAKLQDEQGDLAGYIPERSGDWGGKGEGYGITTNLGYSFTGFVIAFGQTFHTVSPESDNSLIISLVIKGVAGITRDKLVDDANKVIDQIQTLIRLAPEEQIVRADPTDHPLAKQTHALI